MLLLVFNGNMMHVIALNIAKCENSLLSLQVGEL